MRFLIKKNNVQSLYYLYFYQFNLFVIINKMFKCDLKYYFFETSLIQFRAIII